MAFGLLKYNRSGLLLRSVKFTKSARSNRCYQYHHPLMGESGRKTTVRYTVMLFSNGISRLWGLQPVSTPIEADIIARFSPKAFYAFEQISEVK